MKGISEQEYIKRFVNGDNGAFDFLIRKWQGPIYQLAFRYVGNEHDAKDVCQNTFIRAYKNIKKLKDEASFSTWLYRIAVNLCKDELKKRKKKARVDLSLLESNESYSEHFANPGNKGIEENIMEKDIQEIVKRIVNSLSEEQKMVVILKEYQGLKFREVADVLKISENTAKSRMYYALNNIKNMLEKQNLDKEVYTK